MPIVDPKVKILDLLVANWNPANTSSITPKIHTGWYNAAWTKTPQITITASDYSTLRGGSTGITAFKGSGGFVSIQFADMIVAPWAHRDMTNSVGTTFTSLGINPKTFVYDCSNEIKRIIRANITSDAELDYMAWRGMTEIVESKVKPVLFRYNHEVRASFTEAF